MCECGCKNTQLRLSWLLERSIRWRDRHDGRFPREMPVCSKICVSSNHAVTPMGPDGSGGSLGPGRRYVHALHTVCKLQSHFTQ